MLRRGFLGNTAIYPTLAHTPEIVAKYEAAVDEVFAQIADVLKSGDLAAALDGPVCDSDFRRVI